MLDMHANQCVDTVLACVCMHVSWAPSQYGGTPLSHNTLSDATDPALNSGSRPAHHEAGMLCHSHMYGCVMIRIPSEPSIQSLTLKGSPPHNHADDHQPQKQSMLQSNTVMQP
jgi:hypothetical protein